MLLLDKSPIDIWRMLLPAKQILFPAIQDDDLIFQYRSHIYFVHEDGAVIRMKKPEHPHKLSQEDLWDALFHEHDTFDYEEHGIFSIGGILLHMGFMLPLKAASSQSSFQIEIVNKLDPELPIHSYELSRVSFRFALYHSLIRCHEWNAQNEELEFEVQQISRIEDEFGQLDLPFTP